MSAAIDPLALAPCLGLSCGQRDRCQHFVPTDGSASILKKTGQNGVYPWLGYPNGADNQCPGYLARAVIDTQPDPTPNDRPAVWDLVLDDMQARDRLGAARYGTRLQPFNGRDTLRDAYEEALDLAVYLRQVIYERDHPAP